ncbi:endoribonuclease YbeY [mine drainage metagenome]|uniref:Endoribonuclease YbeY n=1 Tax=mine drainage metagenome TaxID=410659 RepID=A0A1J5Q0L9_9ZZZZ
MIDVEIEDDRWSDAVADAQILVARAAEAALAGAQRTGGVVVLLTDDAAQHALNLRFRGKGSSTNVLSFPAPENPEDHLGDISLAFEVCAAEARDQAKPVAHHLQHLVAHGVLHLVGYDHETDAEALEMEALERVVLAGLGVPDPYKAERGDDGEYR